MTQTKANFVALNNTVLVLMFSFYYFVNRVHLQDKLREIKEDDKMDLSDLSTTHTSYTHKRLSQKKGKL